MSKRSDRLPALLLASLPMVPGAALGHAAIVEAEAIQAVRVEGRFESGEPMAGAQVTVYAPANPAMPWMLGHTDADGVFLFVPDDQPGRWAVQLRQAGHGGIAYLERTAAAAVLSTAPATTPSPVQKTVMAACVIWGCIGTALYFRRGRAG